jgi:hypothetical protein
MLSSEIALLMYSTSAVQSDESARKQRLALVLPYVLLWSNRAVIHLENDDSRNDPPPRGRLGRTPLNAKDDAISAATRVFAHRGDGKRFIVRADEKLTAFIELESAIRARGELS